MVGLISILARTAPPTKEKRYCRRDEETTPLIVQQGVSGLRWTARLMVIVAMRLAGATLTSA